MITGIVVALPEEVTTLTSKRIEKRHCVFIRDKVLIAYSGAGADNAKIAADLLINKGANRLISWGCAAALSDSLKPGDLVLADTLIDVDDNELTLSSAWYDFVKSVINSVLPVYSGALTESVNIISSSREKQHLNTITNAVALDMESIAVAKVAKQKSLPFISVRAIVDPANMNLPQAIRYAATDAGDIVLSRLLLFIALHPTELPGLIRLARYFNAAKKTLVRVASKLDQITDFNKPLA